jgi:uncharacterized membrane protein
MSELDKFPLYYEDLERKPMNTSKTTNKTVKKATKTPSKPKINLKALLEDTKKSVRSFLDNTKKSIILHRKKVKKLTKTQKKELQKQKLNGIIGIGLLFVVVSIAYSTYMTNLFVDGTMMVVALTPQVIFATVTLLIAFYKIYK